MTASAMNRRLFEAFFGPRSGEPVPDFTIDIEMSWILLQRLLEDHRWVEVVGTDDGTWVCRVHDPEYSDLKWLGTLSGEGPTAPLAICEVALRLVETRSVFSSPPPPGSVSLADAGEDRAAGRPESPA